MMMGSEINGQEFRHHYGRSMQIQAAIDLNRLRHSLTSAPLARRRKPTRTPEPAPHPSKEWLTRAEAAAMLSMTEEQIRGLMRHGHLKLGTHYVKPTERILRFRRSALERWMVTSAAQRVEPQPDLSDDELRAQLAARAKQLKKEMAR